MGFIRKAFDLLAHPTQSRTIAILVGLILIAAIPLTVMVSQQQQQTRQQAEEAKTLSSCIPPYSENQDAYDLHIKLCPSCSSSEEDPNGFNCRNCEKELPTSYKELCEKADLIYVKGTTGVEACYTETKKDQPCLTDQSQGICNDVGACVIPPTAMPTITPSPTPISTPKLSITDVAIEDAPGEFVKATATLSQNYSSCLSMKCTYKEGDNEKLVSSICESADQRPAADVVVNSSFKPTQSYSLTSCSIFAYGQSQPLDTWTNTDPKTLTPRPTLPQASTPSTNSTQTTSPTTPTLTPSTIAIKDTVLSFQFKLPGITEQPKHKYIQYTVAIFDQQKNKIKEMTGVTDDFDEKSNMFKDTLVINEKDKVFPTGSYFIKIKPSKYLTKEISVPITITAGTTTSFAPVSPVAGDINGDNKINIQDYNVLAGCFGNKAQSGSCTSKETPYTGETGTIFNADLNDDGAVDGIDYNTFLKNFNLEGD